MFSIDVSTIIYYTQFYTSFNGCKVIIKVTVISNIYFQRMHELE